MNLHKLLALAALILWSAGSQAQLFYNNGAVVQATNGAIVQVNGDVSNNGAAGLIDNNGDMTITGGLTNNATAGGDGDYHVAGHFINNSTFNGDNGRVDLNGANQNIGGTQITTFHDLLLTGTGVKTQQIDARVSNLLALNDRELATEAHTMSVDNPATTAITRTSGFVSSLVGGALTRATASTNVYEFPTGSSLGTPRYRPVNITPGFPIANTYSVRFANHDASTESYDRSSADSTICEANPNWFHMISRVSGTSSAELAINVEPADGSWNGMANWNGADAEWQNTGSAALAGNYMVQANWNTFNYDPYILTNRKANATITPVSPLCDNASAVTLTGAETGGTWTGTGVSTSGTFDPSAAGAGTHTITYTIAGTCGDTDQVDIVVNDTPDLSGLITNESCVGAGDGSVDLSVSGGTGDYIFVWSNASDTEDVTALTPGTYTVTVSDEESCTRIANFDILAGTGECIPESFYIPNIFSPNGDSQNDVLYLRGSGIKTIHLMIFDRWGEKVFETEDPTVGWDGTFRGTEMENAVFVYTVKAEMNSGTTYDQKGNITLIR